MKCDFCENEGEWENIIMNLSAKKEDGSETIVCDECMILYVMKDWDELVNYHPTS